MCSFLAAVQIGRVTKETTVNRGGELSSFLNPAFGVRETRRTANGLPCRIFG
jgi:hypothetical protein